MAMDMLCTCACRYSSVCIAFAYTTLVVCSHPPWYSVWVCVLCVWGGPSLAWIIRWRTCRCAVAGHLISSLCFACQTSAGNRAIVGWKRAGPEDPAYRLLSPPCSRHPALPFGATVICSRLLQNRVSSVQMGWQGFKYCSSLLSSDQLKLPFS